MKNSLAVEQRCAKVCMFRNKMSVRQTAQALQMSKSKVQRFLATRNFVAKKRGAKKPPRRTPRKTHRARFNVAVRLLREGNRFQSAKALSLEAARRNTPIGCPQTIRNNFRRHGYKSMVRPLCPKHKEGDPEKRVSFCKKELRVRKGSAAFRRLLFSDEKNFDLNDHGPRREWVAPGKKAQRRERERYAGAVMIWAVIGVGYRDMVVFPVTKATKKHLDAVDDDDDKKKAYRLNAQQYLKRCLYPRVGHWVSRGAVFQYDGACCHKAKKVLGYMTSKELEYIADWPARSCDLNPIENCWAELQKLVSLRRPATVVELAKVVKEEFDKMPQEHIDNYVLSYARRLEKCIRSKGAAV